MDKRSDATSRKEEDSEKPDETAHRDLNRSAASSAKSQSEPRNAQQRHEPKTSKKASSESLSSKQRNRKVLEARSGLWSISEKLEASHGSAATEAAAAHDALSGNDAKPSSSRTSAAAEDLTKPDKEPSRLETLQTSDARPDQTSPHKSEDRVVSDDRSSAKSRDKSPTGEDSIQRSRGKSEGNLMALAKSPSRPLLVEKQPNDSASGKAGLRRLSTTSTLDARDNESSGSGKAGSLTSSTTSYYASTFSTLSGPSKSTRTESSAGKTQQRRPSFSRTSTSNMLSVGDGNSRLLKMSLKREWTQVELALRYMARSDPGLFVVDDETGVNPLMLASRDNRIVVVERLLEMGVNVNDRAQDGQAAIHFAVANGREEIVNLLIKKKSDLSLKGGENQQLPLHMACARAGNNSAQITQTLLRTTPKILRLEPDKEGKIPLFHAIEANNQGAYRDLLSQFTEEQLRYQNPVTGSTVLHMSCERRDAEMVRLFCKKGSLVNVQNKEGSTALHIAAAMGDVLIIECLYAHKANPDLFDNLDRTPLQIAAVKGHTAVVELLADRFPKSVLRRTKDGSTLMHIASERGHPETALAFLKRGVPLHMPNKSGAVCLHSAAKNNHVDVVRTLLMKGAHVDARTKDKLTALHVAVQYCRPLVVQMLLGFGAPVQIKGGEKQETPLHLAAQISDGELVAEMLIKSGADANCAREDGETAVHMAARKGNLKTFKLLLEEGGDARTQSKTGENALHIAARHCRWEIVQNMIEFLESKFSRYEATMCVNMENVEGETPLHLAAELTRDRAHEAGDEMRIVSYLLSYGGDVNFCTKLTQETPVHYCARAGNDQSLRILLDHIGKDPQKMPSIINRQAKNGWSPLLFASDEGHAASVDTLLQHSARVDVFDENGKAALHLAAGNGHDVIADMLIRKKAFINAKTKLGLTPLHLAAQRGYNDLAKKLLNPMGTDQNAAIDALSLDKKTPLHKAAEDGQIDVCHTLLKAGADVEAVDNDGQTPLHLAAENDHSNVVKMFLGHRSDLVTKANKSGWTCAHIAASKGSVAVIQELLNSNKESVTTATNTTANSTALHLAASKGHAEIVRELILNGANPMEEDSDGMNALHLSAKHGHSNIIDVIVSSKSEIEERVKLPLTSLWQAVSSKTGFNVLHVATQSGNETFAREMLHRIRAAEASQPPGVRVDSAKETSRDYGFTPLHLASQSGHVNLVRMILNYPGVSVDASTAVQKAIPLHLAAHSGYVAVVGLLLSKSIHQLRCVDAKGFTCLHYAATYGHLDMAAMLIGQGADIDVPDKNGLTPLHLAAKSGSLKMVKLLTETGASTKNETKQDKRIPIQFAAASRHHNVVSFLINCEHDTYKLIGEKTFVCDLMLVAKSPITPSRRQTHSSSSSKSRSSFNDSQEPPATNMDILEEFVLASAAPIDAASKLSRAFTLASNREKEQAKNLLECAAYCENLAVDLLEICSAANGANDILKATDRKLTPFLDVLIECEQKNVIAHPAVQKYLSDVWVGNLKWSDWKFALMFFLILFVPIFWLFLSLPFHVRSRIPIIKFIVNLVSHFYLIALFVIAVAVPITPIYRQSDLIPEWNEWLLLVWVSGVLVNEITGPGGRTGIARIRTVVLVLCALAIVVHLIAFAFPSSETNARLQIIYVRNIFLATAMTFAVVQLLEFLSFHYLFGPWTIIIEGLLNDLIKFGVIVIMFIAAFTMCLAAVYQPVFSFETNTTAIVGTATSEARLLNPLDTFQILFFALFGLIEPDNLPPVNRSPHFTIYLVQIVFGLYHVITLIVLINLLIAMMSDTYQRIQAQSDTEWKFGRAKLIRNMKKTSLSPAPINLFITFFQYLKLLVKHKGRACDVGMDHQVEDDHDVNAADDTYDVIMNHNNWTHQRQVSSNQERSPTGINNAMRGEDVVRNRGYTAEAGNRSNSLEHVVDWSIIRQKYWTRKGKTEKPSDPFSSLLRETEYNLRSEDSSSGSHRKYRNGTAGMNHTTEAALSPENGPHNPVPYTDRRK